MRIVYILTTLGMGGAERQALDLGQRMVQRGHAVQVFTLGPPLAEEWETDLPVIRLGVSKDPLGGLASLARAQRHLRRFRPDLLHSHCFHSNLFARLLRLGGARVPVISTVHNIYEGPWSRMMAYRLTDALAAKVVTVSQASADRYVRLKAAHSEKVQVISNGFDPSFFTPDASRRAQTRKAAGIEKEFLWLSVGRLTPAKNFPNLLRAFAAVHAVRPEARLWIAGSGEREETACLQEQARALEAQGALRWLGVRRNLRALLDAADGFVLGSDWEGMPLAIGEAMAMQTPVVATDVGGVRELMGSTGLLVPPRDASSLASAMLETMTLTAEERASRSLLARKRIEKDFSMSARVESWESLYRTVLERKP